MLMKFNSRVHVTRHKMTSVVLISLFRRLLADLINLVFVTSTRRIFCCGSRELKGIVLFVHLHCHVNVRDKRLNAACQNNCIALRYSRLMPDQLTPGSSSCEVDIRLGRVDGRTSDEEVITITDYDCTTSARLLLTVRQLNGRTQSETFGPAAYRSQ